MSGATKILAAAGSKADPVYVENVFSIDTWLANDTNGREIENGIDLAGEGGLVWIKNRGAGGSSLNHLVCDTLRPVSGGNAPRLMTNSGGVEASYSFGLQSFNDDGYSIGSAGDTNSGTTRTYVGWTFRKTAGFFDMVKYTGNGNDQTISHNLGSTPGFAIIKGIDTGNANWITWHRSHGNDKYSVINSSSSHGGDLDSSRTVNSTTFQILGDSSHDQGGFDHESTDGREYMLYLFAHDDESFGEDGDESIIQCGTYDGNGSTAGPEIDLGWEAQWVMIKNIEDTAGDNTLWIMADIMRGMHLGDENDPYIAANNANEEYTSYNWIHPTATGFKLTNTGVSLNESGTKYIYIAIRRPHKPAEAGTDFFSPYAYSDTGLTSGSGTAANRTILNGGSNGGTGFPVDMFWHRDRADNKAYHIFDRLRGQGNSLLSSASGGQPQGDGATNSGFDFMEGVDVEYNGTMYYYTSGAGNRNHIGLFFKRSPGTFDIVGYRGNSTSGHNVSHGLGKVPEFMLIKRYTGSRVWIAYAGPLGNTKYLQASGGAGSGQNAAATSTAHWNDTTPTASVFTLGNSEDVNGNMDYIAYLFCSSDVSDVGTWTSDGSGDLTVTTGFQPRFVMCKNTSDASTDWKVWDSAHGITSGADKPFDWNADVAEISDSEQDIHPLSTGFTVDRGSPEVNHNDSGKVYLYLAIA